MSKIISFNLGTLAFPSSTTGSIIFTPQSRNLSRFFLLAGELIKSICATHNTINGIPLPIIELAINETALSVIPFANFAIVLVVEGIIIIISAGSFITPAKEICSKSPDIAVIGSTPVAHQIKFLPIIFSPSFVITGIISAPCLINSLAISGDLYAATLPVIPNIIRFPFKMSE